MSLNLYGVSRVLAHHLIERVSRRAPDFVIGAQLPGGPYLNRWYLTPWRHWQADRADRARAHPTTWNRLAARLARLLPNLYLHQFLRDDDDRALHDHPSCGVSLLLRGGYIEHTIHAGGVHRRVHYSAGTLRFMGVRHAHRIELERWNCYYPHLLGGDHLSVAQPVPCWTLFLFGPAVREWGFHCPERGWVHWQDFTKPDAAGEMGKGCEA